LISSDGRLGHERIKELQHFLQKPSLFFLIPGIKEDPSVRGFINHYISKSIQTTDEMEQAGDPDPINLAPGSRSRILEAVDLDMTAVRIAFEQPIIKKQRFQIKRRLHS